MYKNSVERFKEIVRVLAFYGFGYVVNNKIKKDENKSPSNLKKALEELGPTFIKIGQILSTRPDILPNKYIVELSKLQDDVVPENFSDINEVFRKEFGKNIDECFLYFNESPLASASTAQVYTAILNNGREVIVKIQRPHIYEKMHLDMSILSKIIALTKTKFTDSLIDPKEALDEILSATEQELDFENEKDNINKFKELNKDVAFLYAPYIIDEFSSNKILTMEKINGFKIDNLKKLDEGNYDVYDLGKKLALSYFKQVFEDGFFHGDPHPGNLLIQDGKICYIDFGIVGSFSKSLKDALNDAIISVAYKDPDKLISVLMSIGIKKGFVNRNKLYEDIDYLFDSYLSTSLQNIEMSVLLQEIFDCAKRNNIKLPKDLTLLIRGTVIIEGVLAKISPDIKILDIAIPFVKSNNKFSIFKELNSDEILIRSYKFAKDFYTLPTKMIELSNSILNGRAKIQLQINSLNRSINELNKMVNRVVYALIISSMIIGSSLILNTNIGPKIYDISIIGVVGYGIAAFMGFRLLISIIKSGKL
ncbi:ABC1 kinase family protein [Clostridium lundense]|uniref:ABC1 kinase family protein n=1 Tax=Clostridium lundense TaxID=319475 RepID=UPI0004898294|nr:AarF/ABC1/UbiB kinase family protein [Clostridium lundense]